MCDCLENMPEVSKADASCPRNGSPTFGKACPGNDLRSRWQDVYGDGDALPNLVGKCDNAD